MPKTLPPGLDFKKDAEENEPLNLFDIQIDDTTTVYLVRRESGFTFDGKVYEPFNINFDAISFNTSGRIAAVRIIAGNVGLQIGAFLRLNNALRGRRVIIWQIDRSEIADAAEKFRVFTGYVRDADTNEKAAVLNCTSRLESLNVRVPAFSYSRTMCQYAEFDDDGVSPKKRFCGWKRFVNSLNPAYPSASPAACDKTPSGKNGCDAHNNLDRQGAFRGLGTTNAAVV